MLYNNWFQTTETQLLHKSNKPIHILYTCHLIWCDFIYGCLTWVIPRLLSENELFAHLIEWPRFQLLFSNISWCETPNVCLVLIKVGGLCEHQGRLWIWEAFSDMSLISCLCVLLICGIRNWAWQIKCARDKAIKAINK